MPYDATVRRMLRLIRRRRPRRGSSAFGALLNTTEPRTWNPPLLKIATAED